LLCKTKSSIFSIVCFCRKSHGTPVAATTSICLVVGPAAVIGENSSSGGNGLQFRSLYTASTFVW
jgi:hypothetical protein